MELISQQDKKTISIKSVLKTTASLFVGMAALFIFSCSTAKKERLEQREKIVGSSGLFCDFVNGEKYSDVEVVLNIEMAKRCDSNKSFSVSSYKSPAEVVGMVYCCSTKGGSAVAKSGGTGASNSSGGSVNVNPASMRPAATGTPSNPAPKKDSQSNDEIIEE